MTHLVRFTAAACALLSTTAAAVAPDTRALRSRLLALPVRGDAEAVIVLPLGESKTSSFRVRDSLTLPKDLIARFPGLRSFRGIDAEGRRLRLDIAPSGMRASIRDGTDERVLRLGVDTPEPHPPATAATPDTRTAQSGLAPGRVSLARAGGTVRYDFRLAVAASSRYVAATGGTVASALAEIAHTVNRANEVFETDLGVHFTLAGRNDRIVRADPSRDPFLSQDPGPAAVELIDAEIGRRHYDLGHAVTTHTGGDSYVGTSCSDARDADFFATHKAAAWSGYPDPAHTDAVGYFIHVLGRQLGAWPTANGCGRHTLDDRAMEPGGGSTAMGYAPAGCGGEGQWLQTASDRYFHAANVEQVQAWLGSRGGRCAAKRLTGATAPWIDSGPLAERTVIPARTPFVLDARAEPSTSGRRLTYTWDQMDAGRGQRGALQDPGDGPLFRSLPPSTASTRLFPRLAAVLGHETAEPGETLPTTSRQLNFRVTVRERSTDNEDEPTQASADTRIHVVDTGRAFRLIAPDAGTIAVAGAPLHVQWDVAGTTDAPISCHFVHVDLSTDGGHSWLASPLAQDERNDGEATVMLPPDSATGRARLRLRCDWRPFLAISPGDFVIRSR
jgi:hypothetical protein